MNAFFSSQHFLQNFALDNSNLQITRTFFIFLKGSSKETEQGKWQCKNKVFVLWRLQVLQKLAARQTVVTQVTIILSCSAKLVKLSIANCLYIVVVVLHLKPFNKEPFSVLDSATCRKFWNLSDLSPGCSVRYRAKLCQVYANLEKTAKIKLTFWTHKMNALVMSKSKLVTGK